MVCLNNIEWKLEEHIYDDDVCCDWKESKEN